MWWRFFGPLQSAKGRQGLLVAKVKNLGHSSQITVNFRWIWVEGKIQFFFFYVKIPLLLLLLFTVIRVLKFTMNYMCLIQYMTRRGEMLFSCYIHLFINAIQNASAFITNLIMLR